MLRRLLILTMLCVGLTDVAVAQSQWPAVAQQHKPWTRWWWLGGAYDADDVRHAMQQYADVGLGGLEVTQIYGVQGDEAHYRPFLSPSWLDLFDVVLAEARRHDMGIDLANASGWPFGGPWIDEAQSCKTKVLRHWTLQPGQAFDGRVTCHQEAMMRGHHVPASPDSVLLPLRRNTQLQQWALEQWRPERDLPLVILTANGPDGQVLDLTHLVAPDGTLPWTAPSPSAGEWLLTALFEGDHGKLVERAGPGGEGLVIDHFDREACRAFLQRFDSAFVGRDLSALRYFFNDSYEVDDARGMSDWTPQLFQHFYRLRGYDLRQHLPALLGMADAETCSRVTYDYRQTLDDLLLQQYAITWAEWARDMGKGIRNQAHGSPANILDLYSVSDVPEIEGRDLISIKAAPSAAHFNGKPLVSAEACTWLDEHFLGRLGDVRRAVDLFFLGGVNHVFFHGTCFSPRRAAWPGWMFYAAAHFEPNNPWWGDLRHLNAYITRVQSWLQQGQADTDLLVYYNITDQQATFNAERPLRHYAGLDREMQTSLTRQCVASVDSLGYAYDLVSDRQLAELRVLPDGRLLSPGGGCYQAVLLPPSRQYPWPTLQRLRQLAQQGARVVFVGQRPDDVAGLLAYRDRQREVRQWREDDLRAEAQGRQPVWQVCPDVTALHVPGTRPERSLYGQGLLCTRRLLPEGQGTLYLVANRTAQAFEGFVTLAAAQPYGRATLYDAMDGRIGQGEFREGDMAVYLQLRPGQTLLVRLHDGAAEPCAFPVCRPVGQPQPLSMPWQVTFVQGGPTLPPSRGVAQPVAWTSWPDCRAFAGTARYETLVPHVAADGAVAQRLSLGAVANSASVYLNGQYVGTVLDAPWELDVPQALWHGRDTLVVEVSGSMANRLIDMERRGEVWQQFHNINVSARRPENRSAQGYFSVRRWQPLPSGLMGPVTLTPLRSGHR